jgi:hypothetical protein
MRTSTRVETKRWRGRREMKHGRIRKRGKDRRRKRK